MHTWLGCVSSVLYPLASSIDSPLSRVNNEEREYTLGSIVCGNSQGVRSNRNSDSKIRHGITDVTLLSRNVIELLLVVFEKNYEAEYLRTSRTAVAQT